MWIQSAAPYVVGGLEGEQRCGEIRLDEWNGTCNSRQRTGSGCNIYWSCPWWRLTRGFQDLDQRSILLRHLARVDRVTHAHVKAADGDRVLQRHRYPRQRAFEIHALTSCPFLRFGQHHLGETIGLLVGTEGRLAIAAENLDGRDGILVHFRH